MSGTTPDCPCVLTLALTHAHSGRPAYFVGSHQPPQTHTHFHVHVPEGTGARKHTSNPPGHPRHTQTHTLTHTHFTIYRHTQTRAGSKALGTPLPINYRIMILARLLHPSHSKLFDKRAFKTTYTKIK